MSNRCAATTRSPTTSLLGLVARLLPLIFVAVMWIASAHADGVRATSCVRGGGSFSCTTLWRTGTGGSAGPSLWTPRAEREHAEAAERERLWLARCRPIAEYDRHGVKRNRYAAPGCEFGRYE